MDKRKEEKYNVKRKYITKDIMSYFDANIKIIRRRVKKAVDGRQRKFGEEKEIECVRRNGGDINDHDKAEKIIKEIKRERKKLNKKLDYFYTVVPQRFIDITRAIRCWTGSFVFDNG